MRRITFAIMSTIAAVILLFSYRTSTQGAGTAASSTAAGGGAPGIVSGAAPPDPTPTPTPRSGGSTGASPAPPQPARPAKPSKVVVNGSVADTRWGPVQVQVTIAGGKITNVVAIQQPSGNNRDQEINSYALPQLHDQAIRAQSARLDGVSGATVTSDGYTQSLQAALDAAHFG
jgi:uncharacterized protein with FMN-binding domain